MVSRPVAVGGNECPCRRSHIVAGVASGAGGGRGRFVCRCCGRGGARFAKLARRLSSSLGGLVKIWYRFERKGRE